MKSALQKIIFLMAMLPSALGYAQDLRKVAPVLLPPTVSMRTVVPDSISFVLTTQDDNLYKHKPLHYSSGIEIVDADAPWPPRWYTLHSSDTSPDIRPSMMLMLNASYEHGRFRYFTMASAPGRRDELAVITCGTDLQPSDTFFAFRKLMDSHDFISSSDGTLTYFAIHDTSVDLRQAYGHPDEMLVPMVYQSIEIAGPDGKSVFSWNPFYALGFDAIYLPYRYTRGVRSNHSSFDWSHGNSLHYDYDGNILYSFKHIGIGKISRTDGHVIWRIDRNKQRINALSDSLPIFLQHDLQAVRDRDGHISYTVWSNGDSLHPYCMGFQFTDTIDPKGTPIVKLIKTITPSEKISNTGGGGNLDMDADGNYLMNYGLFPQDTTLTSRKLFEYKNVKSGGVVIYETSPTIFTFRVHSMGGWRPPRPVISIREGRLTTDNKVKTVKWYSLSGEGLKTVKYLGEGESYTPRQSGFYCAAAKYGVGWTVSKAFKFDRD